MWKVLHLARVPVTVEDLGVLYCHTIKLFFEVTTTCVEFIVTAIGSISTYLP
jgi:hypothetical protein